MDVDMELDVDSPKRAQAVGAGASAAHQHLPPSVGTGLHSATWAPFLVPSQPLMPYYGMPLPGHLPPLPGTVAAAVPAAAVPHMTAAGNGLAAGVATSAKRKAYAAEARPAMPSQTAAPAASAAPAARSPAVDAAQPQRAPEVRLQSLAFSVKPGCSALPRALLCASARCFHGQPIERLCRATCGFPVVCGSLHSAAGLHTPSKAGSQGFLSQADRAARHLLLLT